MFQNAAGTGDIRINNVLVVNGTAGFAAAGSWNACAIDFTAKLIWFTADGTHWNSNSSVTNNPATGVGGLDISAISATQFAGLAAAGSVSGTRKLTANFGGTAFNFTVPVGFSAWH